MRAWLLAIVPVFAGAAQNDVYPTDFVAQSDGKTTMSAYAIQQQQQGSVKVIVPRSGTATTQLTAVRISHTYALGESSEYAIAPVVVLSSADTEATGTIKSVVGTRASGFGDLRLGTAFWFHIDRANRDYALASIFVTLPTGDYDASKALNIGENRVKTVLSVGWMKTLSERWVMELSQEIAQFGDNDHYRALISPYQASPRRLSQDTAYATTGGLRYKLTPTWHGYASAQVNRGGATQLNDAALADAPNNVRVSIGTLLIIGDQSQVQLRYAEDARTSSAFRNAGELALRWIYAFR